MQKKNVIFSQMLRVKKKIKLKKSLQRIAEQNMAKLRRKLSIDDKNPKNLKSPKCRFQVIKKV